MKSGGESSKFIVCIGWDRNAVWKLADEANKERYEREAKEQERAAKEREEEWEEVMEVHRELVASIKKKKGKKGPTTQRKRLNKCRGSYAIQCEDLSGKWDNCDSLGIDIAAGPKPNILQAAVGFNH